jgi:hypothetical protein
MFPPTSDEALEPNSRGYLFRIADEAALDGGPATVRAKSAGEPGTMARLVTT